jgi:hypothetical protein
MNGLYPVLVTAEGFKLECFQKIESWTVRCYADADGKELTLPEVREERVIGKFIFADDPIVEQPVEIADEAAE